MKEYLKNKDERRTTIDCINAYKDTFKIDSVNYQPNYFNFGDYCKPPSGYKGHENENEYYSYVYEKTYFIENDSFKIIVFKSDCIDIDCEHWVYFNNQVGYLAAYSGPWGITGLCVKINDSKKDRFRGLIIDKLLTDTTFFPDPRAYYQCAIH